MRNKTKTIFLKTVLLAGLALGSTAVFAAPDTCGSPPYTTLVANVIQGQQNGTPPTTNNTVCIDVPVELNDEQALFNIDSQAMTNGTASGYPVALRHMWMLGTANLARVQGIINHGGPNLLANFHIKGVIHGSAITWALSDAWWAANVPGATGNPYKEWLDKINTLREVKHLDIQLEACGVTMYGKGLTHDDLYPGILVNQGAIGRIIDLEQQGWAYIQEGFVDNDSAYLTKSANN